MLETYCAIFCFRFVDRESQQRTQSWANVQQSILQYTLFVHLINKKHSYPFLPGRWECWRLAASVVPEPGVNDATEPGWRTYQCGTHCGLWSRKLKLFIFRAICTKIQIELVTEVERFLFSRNIFCIEVGFIYSLSLATAKMAACWNAKHVVTSTKKEEQFTIRLRLRRTLLTVFMTCDHTTGDRSRCSNHGYYCTSPTVGCVCDRDWTGSITPIIYS